MQRRSGYGRGAWPGAGGVATILLSALATLAGQACSGRTVGPSLGAGGSSGDDGGYGGGFPAIATPAADATGGNTPPPDPAQAVPGGGDLDANGGYGARDTSARGLTGDGGYDAGVDGECASPLARGALVIDEILVASVAGAGDNGEWFEVSSDLDCVANLSGLHGECPRGSKVATFDIAGDMWLPPHGTFVVADSVDPAINHHLPGVLVVWLGHPGDVLRNQGSTLTLSLNGSLIDTVTYPSLSRTFGASMAFPSSCDAGLRGDFTHWQRSTASWFPGFFGTPNAPNTDVECL